MRARWFLLSWRPADGKDQGDACPPIFSLDKQPQKDADDEDEDEDDENDNANIRSDRGLHPSYRSVSLLLSSHLSLILSTDYHISIYKNHVPATPLRLLKTSSLH